MISSSVPSAIHSSGISLAIPTHSYSGIPSRIIPVLGNISCTQNANTWGSSLVQWTFDETLEMTKSFCWSAGGVELVVWLMLDFPRLLATGLLIHFPRPKCLLSPPSLSNLESTWSTAWYLSLLSPTLSLFGVDGKLEKLWFPFQHPRYFF